LVAQKEKRRALVSELGRIFLKTRALRIGSFTTSDGRKTPYFIELRPAIGLPSAVSIGVECLEYELREINDLNPECICGIPMIGLIFSSILAFKLGSSLLYHSKVGGEHKISGIVKPGSKVIVLDDVSESGLSIESAAIAIRANGGVVTDALTIIDRSEGAREVLAKNGITLHSFTTVHELARTLKENLALSDEEAEIVEENPEAPSGHA